MYLNLGVNFLFLLLRPKEIFELIILRFFLSIFTLLCPSNFPIYGCVWFSYYDLNVILSFTPEIPVFVMISICPCKPLLFVKLNGPSVFIRFNRKWIIVSKFYIFQC